MRDAAPKLSEDVAADNPLNIGGQFYLRGQVSGRQERGARRVDAQLAIAAGRLLRRPPQRAGARVRAGAHVLRPHRPPSVRRHRRLRHRHARAGGATTPTAQGPRVVLDQMWLRFDIKHTVFVTAGRQHVKWGTARVWQPTDFLHVVKRNPLDVFDARTGSSMLKLHVPWEERGWNFYAYGMTENAAPRSATWPAPPAPRWCWGRPSWGWAACSSATASPGWPPTSPSASGTSTSTARRPCATAARSTACSTTPTPCPRLAPPSSRSSTPRYPGVYRKSGIKPQVTGGFTYSRQYADKDVWTIGGEYFFNSLGYDDPGTTRACWPRAACCPSRRPSSTWAATTPPSSSCCRRRTPGTSPPSPSRPSATSRTSPSSPASTTR